MAFLRETLDRVDAIISPSQFLRDLFIEAGIARERIVFSRQGRDFSTLTTDLLEKTPATHLRVGYMGQIAPHKGVHMLFEAVRQLSDAALEVKAYGDPTPFPGYTHSLRQMIRQDPRLSLEGVYEQTEVSRVLQGLDVVVVPSVWYENSPNTILEAFAHHTPVIVADLGGMAELVKDGVNGLRFAPGSASSLAAKLQQLIDSPDLLSQLQKGIRPVKSVAEEMTELKEMYRSLVSEADPIKSESKEP
jgi:glycosyltransferase involved in cell wall biosynthesis